MSFLDLSQPLAPVILAEIGNMDEQYSYMQTAGLVWNGVAEDINSDNSDVDGRYVEATGEIHGTGNVKRQDTYRSGQTKPDGSAFSGRAFAASGGGTWIEQVYGPYNCWMLCQPNAGLDNTNAPTLTAAAPTTRIEHAEIVLMRGWPPVSSSGGDYSADNFFAYLYLAWGSPDGIDYRIAYEYGQPVGLDRTTDSWQTFKTTHTLRNVAMPERSMRGEQYTWRMTIKPDHDVGRLLIEVNDGHWFRDAPSGPPKLALPQQGKIRLETQNGWTRFGYFPLRHQPIAAKVTGGSLPPGRSTQNALILTGAQSAGDDSTETKIRIAPDGQQMTAEITAERPDAGDGEGSAEPAKFTAFQVILPAEYVFELEGGNITGPPPTGILRSKVCDELHVMDDATRTFYHSGVITCSNTGQLYTGSYGRIALNLRASADFGGSFEQRMQGIGGDGAEGVKFSAAAHELDLMQLPITDKMPALMVPINDEMQVDGWAWPNAVHFFASQKGNIHPSYLQYLPTYIPPDGSAELPYGKAGEDCPFYTLPSGLGSTPLSNYLPYETPYSIIQPLIAQITDIDEVTGAQYPYYWGFDEWGNLRAQAFDFAGMDSALAFADAPYSGTFPILSRIEVFNSVAQMRTDLHFQTTDNRTGELLYYYLPMPNAIKRAVGFNFGWLERSARFGNEEGLIQIANSASIQAGIPQQNIRFASVFIPWLRAGMKFWVASSRALGGAFEFVATSVRARYGMNDPAGGSPSISNNMIIEARRAENFAM